MAYEYVKQTYGVNPEPGMRVTSLDGKHSGVIVGREQYDNYVWVSIDRQSFPVNFHPLDLVYLPPEAQ